jgi:hypothetical protein
MEGDSGWVLYAEEGHHLERAARRVRRAGVVRLVPLAGGAVCAELSDPPSDAVRRRVEAALDREVEQRMNCDVAHFPLGRGFVVWFVDPPADGLEGFVDQQRPVYRELVRPLDLGEAVRLCLPGLSVADPQEFDRALRDAGFLVRASYEVGGCRRP